VRIDVANEGIAVLRLNAALAPLGPAWTPWTRAEGQTVLTDLSRHVTVHGADTEQYTEAHSMIALLFMVSVLPGFADWEDRPKREVA
jgi:hypothetical protein